MTTSLAGIPPLSGMRGGSGGSGIGRGLGSLAPLGRPALPPTMPIGLDSLSLGSGISTNPSLANNPLNKPKLGTPAAVAAAATRSPSSQTTRNLGIASPTSSSYHGSPSSSNGHSQSSPSSRVQPIKFAVRFNPPTIALEYRDKKYPTRTRNKLRIFTLTAIFTPSQLQIDTSSSTSRLPLETLARSLSTKFPEYLSATFISLAQLTRIVKKALSRPNVAPSSGVGTTRPTTSASISSSQHDSEEYSMVEDELEVSIGSQGSEDYASSPTATASRHLSSTHPSKPSSVHTNSAPTFHIPGSEPPPDEEDLNRLSNEELNQKKAEMDKVFRQTLLKPGDPGYVYDKQVDFQPTEESEWD